MQTIKTKSFFVDFSKIKWVSGVALTPQLQINMPIFGWFCKLFKNAQSPHFPGLKLRLHKPKCLLIVWPAEICINQNQKYSFFRYKSLCQRPSVDCSIQISQFKQKHPIKSSFKYNIINTYIYIMTLYIFIYYNYNLDWTVWVPTNFTLDSYGK